jgi:hypothetical protein
MSFELYSSILLDDVESRNRSHDLKNNKVIKIDGMESG